MASMLRLAAILVFCGLITGCGVTTGVRPTTQAQQQSLQTLDQASRLGSQAD